MPNPSSPSSMRPSFTDCRQTARSVRRAGHGRQALAHLRPRAMTGTYREPPPLAVLLSLLGRQNLVVCGARPTSSSRCGGASQQPNFVDEAAATRVNNSTGRSASVPTALDVTRRGHEPPRPVIEPYLRIRG